MRYAREFTECAMCPYEHNDRVRSECGVATPSIVVIGEAPGAEEETAGVPFVGGAGKILQRAMSEAGIIWHSVYRMNVINCRPPNNDIVSLESRMALTYCKAGFLRELQGVIAKGAKVIIPLGNTAISALGINLKISNARGSVFEYEGIPVVPTYHPAFLLRGQFKLYPVWVADLRKARDLSVTKWAPPIENYNLFPTVKDIEAFVDDSITNNKLIAVDLEATGLNTRLAKIIMIGLATSSSNALCVPVLKRSDISPSGEAYWNSRDLPIVIKQLRRLFRSCKTMYHNAVYDVSLLQNNGYTVGHVEHDTMLMHHCIRTDLPHDLPFITSIYGDKPYWKDTVLNASYKLQQLDDTTFRTYNLRDSTALFANLDGLLKDLKETGTERQYYDISLKMIQPIIDMQNYGVGIDKSAFKKFISAATRKSKSLYKKICSEYNIPIKFNLQSGQHVEFLLYGVCPKSVIKAKSIISDDKIKRSTSKYIKNKELVDAFDVIKPLYKTKSAASGTAKDDFIAIRRAAYSRLDIIESMVRPRSEVTKEQNDIEHLLKFISMYEQWKKLRKLVSMYGKLPIEQDGRLHGGYLIHGTATGRPSSSRPNMLNFPKSAMGIFGARPGYTFIAADYSNLELRVLAYVANEPVLIQAFESKKNVHELNTKLLFGSHMVPSNPEYETYKRAAKTYIFGRTYGGTVARIYNNILTQIPNFRMSYSEFCSADKKYFKELANFKTWREATIASALETRMVKNAFGRVRVLTGTGSEMERMAVNTPIQGTAADIANAAFIELHKKLIARKIDAHIIFYIYDALYVECLEKDAVLVRSVMKTIMENPVSINDHVVKFPVEFKIGAHLGPGLKDFEV